MRLLGCITGTVIVAVIFLSLGMVPAQPFGDVLHGGPDQAVETIDRRSETAISRPASTAESLVHDGTPESSASRPISASPAPASGSDEKDGPTGVSRETETGREQRTSPGDAALVTAEAGGDHSKPEPISSEEESQGSWEAFFTPFRSQASAEGFARFLGSATGHEFRVGRAGPGQYRVWFRIEDGESRPQRIAEIEAVTGMRLQAGDL